MSLTSSRRSVYEKGRNDIVVLENSLAESHCFCYYSCRSATIPSSDIHGINGPRFGRRLFLLFEELVIVSFCQTCLPRVIRIVFVRSQEPAQHMASADFKQLIATRQQDLIRSWQRSDKIASKVLGIMWLEAT